MSRLAASLMCGRPMNTTRLMKQSIKPLTVSVRVKSKKSRRRLSKMAEQNFKCNPPHSCFSCPLPDCILSSDETPEELNFVARHAPRKGSHDEAYEWYVAHGICVRCRKRPALPGKVLCIECKEKACEKAKSRYKSQDVKKQQYERVKKRIAKCEKTGRCLICGKPVYDGHTLCMEHYLAARRKSHERYEQKMQEKREHDARRAAELRDVYNAEKCLVS